MRVDEPEDGEKVEPLVPVTALEVVGEDPSHVDWWASMGVEGSAQKADKDMDPCVASQDPCGVEVATEGERRPLASAVPRGVGVGVCAPSALPCPPPLSPVPRAGVACGGSVPSSTATVEDEDVGGLLDAMFDDIVDEDNLLLGPIACDGVWWDECGGVTA